ncbi:substrate-binding domain-containing protein [Pseudobacter ginsenosidimutans]|uniref:Ribose transport system substrate-binding protein n=1 Tax=Pseudobacter ginsenosidimutans TaxID=661488 RepID=A0A4Q7M7F3_9BACT|nr:substrate-binding domain-containing protein [Pseudobacter ginsenosidimutans]RZS63946.1 ribose transport system substrate-binding protein [Pseudobacter ginsenosidimutans]
MKSTLKLTMLVAIVSLLFGCIPKNKQQAADSKTSANGYASAADLSSFTVGYCTPTLDAPFYVALERAVKEKVESYGMKYLSTDGQADIAKQVMAVEDLLTKGVNVLIINPIDPKALVPVVKAAKQQGVMVFVLDSYIDDEAPYEAAVFADNEKNGEILGEWVVQNFTQKEMNIAIISGNQGNPVGREKRLGFIKGIADAQLHASSKASIKVVAQGWGAWNNNGGLKAMEDILVAHPYVNLLLAENDAMAMGALKAIREMGMQDKITILGYDAQKEALQLIKSGQYAATAQNSPSILGSTMVEVVARRLNKDETLKRINYTPSVLIDKSNVDRFYNVNALF